MRDRSWIFAWTVFSLSLCLAILPREAGAGGLRCSLGEVVIENLEIGREYSLQTLANVPLTISNSGDETILLRVEPVKPEPAELRAGAEAIPDAAWAEALPDSFELAPAQSRAVELKLRIPDDETLRGRTFQVQFWSHTLPRAGEMLAYGLSSRVLFRVQAARQTAGSALRDPE